MEVLLDIIYYNVVILCLLNYNKKKLFIESTSNSDLIKEIDKNDHILGAPKQKTMD